MAETNRSREMEGAQSIECPKAGAADVFVRKYQSIKLARSGGGRVDGGADGGGCCRGNSSASSLRQQQQGMHQMQTVPVEEQHPGQFCR